MVALDLRRHDAVVEHSAGRAERIPLTPDQPVGEVTRAVLAAVGALGGPVEINPVPQEVPWSVPLDQDIEHARYDPDAVTGYFATATQAALVLAAYRGRSMPVNAWWGSFDLAVSLFSGLRADPPSQDFIMRNAVDSQEVAVGWWPGDARYGAAAFYAYAHPAPPGFARPCPRPRRAGSRGWESTSWTGTTSGRTQIRARQPCSSPGQPFTTRAWPAAGT